MLEKIQSHPERAALLSGKWRDQQIVWSRQDLAVDCFGQNHPFIHSSITRHRKIFTFQGFRLCTALMHLKIAKERCTSWYFPLSNMRWTSWRQAILAERRKMLKFPVLTRGRTAPPRERGVVRGWKTGFALRALKLSLSPCVLLNPLLQGNDVIQRLELNPRLISE